RHDGEPGIRRRRDRALHYLGALGRGERLELAQRAVRHDAVAAVGGEEPDVFGVPVEVDAEVWSKRQGGGDEDAMPRSGLRCVHGVNVTRRPGMTTIRIYGSVPTCLRRGRPCLSGPSLSRPCLSEPSTAVTFFAAPPP